MSPIPIDHLQTLRNDVAVLDVISNLRIPTKTRRTRLNFRCPVCGRFRTATNHRINLARCFSCARNFNPIELVMAERHAGFLEAVKYVEGLLGSSSSQAATFQPHTTPQQHTPGSCGTPLFRLQRRTRGEANASPRANNTKARTTPRELGVTAPRFFFQNGRKSIPPRPICRRRV